MDAANDPIYDNNYPERYPWELVENEAIRATALDIRLSIERPLSLAYSLHWPQHMAGLRMALRLMARHIPPVKKPEHT